MLKKDNLCLDISHEGIYENAVYWLRGFTEPIKTFIDIGAHWGSVSCYLAKNFGASGLAIEPFHWPHLVENIIQNNLEGRILPVPFGVMNRTDIVKFRAIGIAGNDGQISPMLKSDHYCELQPLRVIPFTALPLLIQFPIDFMKIDCEGSEYNFIDKNAPAILSQVRFLYWEWHDPCGFQLWRDSPEASPDIKDIIHHKEYIFDIFTKSGLDLFLELKEGIVLRNKNL